MIIGHQKQWRFLKESVKLGKIPHAFLFSGPEQVGKRFLALEFIKLINCQEKDFNSKPCHKCRSCKDIEKRAYPDLAIIEPEKSQIQISQIRDLISYLSLCPYSSPLKTAIIDQAHLLNRDAQNAFLKTLEEPKGDTCLILIAEYPETLLPTIISRVEKIKFYPVSFHKIEKGLEEKGASSEKAKKIATLSLGKPGRAMDFLSFPQKLEEQDKKIKKISKLISSDLAFRFQYAKDLSDNPQNIKEILEIWLRYFRDVLILKIKNPAGMPENLDCNYSVSKLKKIIETIQNTDHLISTTNVNRRLALEVLMIELGQ